MNQYANRDSKLLDSIKDVQFRPVFIIGDHRSGTTLLHRLLSETGCFNFVSAYHVIRYNEILANHLDRRTDVAKRDLMNTFEALGVKDRIIDKVPATPDSPVEYGFIFAGTENRRARLTPETHAKFLELSRKIQFLGAPDKPLLLKNPWDVMNFMEIKSLVPEARFVFIHRHPISVMTSQLRAIRSLLSARNGFVAMLAPWYDKLFEKPVQLAGARFFDRPPFRVWERLLSLHEVRLARYYLQNIEKLPKSEYVSVKYEELCEKPDETMNRIFEFTRVRPENPAYYKDRIEPRPPKVMGDVWAQYRKILPKIKPFLDYHGYDAEPAWLRR